MLQERFLKENMPGHMGNMQRNVKNVWVYKIDPARNLMWMKGQVSFYYLVPCAEGNFVFIKDVVYKNPIKDENIEVVNQIPNNKIEKSHHDRIHLLIHNHDTSENLVKRKCKLRS